MGKSTLCHTVPKIGDISASRNSYCGAITQTEFKTPSELCLQLILQATPKEKVKNLISPDRALPSGHILE